MQWFRLLVLLLASFPVILLQAGCGGDSTATTTIHGIVSVHEPIEGATISLFDRGGNRLNQQDAVTNSNGAFSISATAPQGGHLLIKATGGKFSVSGEAVAGPFYYVAEMHDTRRHTFYHIGPLSTTIAQYSFAHPEKTVGEAVTALREFFGISNAIEIDNGIYFYHKPLQPEQYWALVQSNGGLNGFYAMLIPYIDANPGGWQALRGQVVTAAAEEESSIYSEIGKDLAEEALSYVGGKAAGWLLSHLGIDSEGVDSTGDQLNAILSSINELKAQLANTTYDSVFRDLRDRTNYFEDGNEKLYHFAQNYPNFPCENYQSDQQKFGYCKSDLQEIRDDLNPKNITTDLRTINDDLVEPTGLVKNSLLALFDKEEVTPHGDKYFAALERFMAFWLSRQQLGFNLELEKKHYQGNSPDNISAFVKEFDGYMKQQTSMFLMLAEKNLAIDIKSAKDYDKSPVARGHVPPLEYVGYVYDKTDWVAANWSFFPDLTYKDKTDKDCHVEPATHDVVCNYYFTRNSDPIWNTSKPANHSAYNKLSPELQRADELVFAKSIYDSQQKSVPRRKPVVVRGYVRPIMYGLNLRFKNHQFPWNSSDATPKMTLVNTSGGQRYDVMPVIVDVSVPEVYYAGKKKPGWGSDGQYARYTFEGLPDGTYQLDVATLNSLYTQHEKIGAHDLPWTFIDGYYKDYKITYTGGGKSQNMLMFMYNGATGWQTK